MIMKTKELTDRKSMFSHLYMNSLNQAAYDEIQKVVPRDGETEWDVKLTLNGIELDICKFDEILGENWDISLENKAKVMASEIVKDIGDIVSSKHTFWFEIDDIVGAIFGEPPPTFIWTLNVSSL